MSRFSQKRYGSDEWETELEIGDIEYSVVVHFETSEPEPSVNWPGNLDITDVVLAETGKSIFGEINSEMFEQLWLSLERYESERYEDPRY